MCKICENGISSCEVHMPETSPNIMKRYPDTPPFCPECGRQLRLQTQAQNDDACEQVFHLTDDRVLVVGMDGPSVGISLSGPARIDELVASIEYNSDDDILKIEVFDSSSCDPRYIAYIQSKYKLGDI